MNLSPASQSSVLFINNKEGLTFIWCFSIKFEDIISNPWLTVLGQGIFIFLTMIIVMLGVEKGLEKASKIMMPLLFIFLLIIVVKSLTLDGALEGVRYILQPRLHDVSMEGVLFALGQSFFTLSLGTTGMITYASYAPKEMTIKSFVYFTFGAVFLLSKRLLSRIHNIYIYLTQ